MEDTALEAGRGVLRARARGAGAETEGPASADVEVVLRVPVVAGVFLRIETGLGGEAGAGVVERDFRVRMGGGIVGSTTEVVLLRVAWI